jgi:hypothetical protein
VCKSQGILNPELRKHSCYELAAAW